MPKIEIEVRLSDEDRALLSGVQTAAKAITGKAAGKGTPKKPAKAEAADEDFEEAGEEEAGEEEAGEEEAGEEEAGEEEGEALTRDDVQAALRDYAAASSKSAALALLKKAGGAEGLSKLKDSKFQAVITAAKAATKKAKATKK